MNLFIKLSFYFCLLTILPSCSTAIQKIILNPDKKQTPDNSQKTVISKKEIGVVEPIEAQAEYVVKTKENSLKVQGYCDKTDKYFEKYNWGKSSCHDFTWHHVRNSHWGNPIVWFVFGDEERRKTEKLNITLIMCGVHGDEITPVKFCYDLLDDLRKTPSVIGDNLVIIAPLVTPDSFFRTRPTRTNGRKVDINRNFPTRDWNKNALKLWKQRYRSDPRRYPGKYALSEQETIFQVNLINLYSPSKIISVHAPLTLLDYDGPTITHEKGKAAKGLLQEMSLLAGKYNTTNYPFFTGSLGNWAGNERGIPTYTLELPNSDWNKTDKYYAMFRKALHHAIQTDLIGLNAKERIKVVVMRKQRINNR